MFAGSSAAHDMSHSGHAGSKTDGDDSTDLLCSQVALLPPNAAHRGESERIASQIDETNADTHLPAGHLHVLGVVLPKSHIALTRDPH